MKKQPAKAAKPKFKANRRFKSSIFSMLFSDVKSVIELVNALLGTRYGADTPTEIVTLKDVLADGKLNDLSIVLDDMLLVLIEHQSTVNPNMAFRMLEYVVEIFKRRSGGTSVYSTRQIRFPRPVFVVLYNGTKKTPARELHRLSAAFAKAIPALAGLGGLELKVLVINMNDPNNKSMIKTCKLLNEYCIFTDKFRRNRKTMCFDNAFKKTVDDCIKRGVLRSFLQKHRKELSTMLVTEWDWDMALKVAKEENFEMGMEKGLGIGMEKGLGIGRVEGIGIGVKNTARNMKKEGMDAKTIARMTGLSIYAIRRL